MNTKQPKPIKPEEILKWVFDLIFIITGVLRRDVTYAKAVKRLILFVIEVVDRLDDHF